MADIKKYEKIGSVELKWLWRKMIGPCGGAGYFLYGAYLPGVTTDNGSTKIGW